MPTYEELLDIVESTDSEIAPEKFNAAIRALRAMSTPPNDLVLALRAIAASLRQYSLNHDAQMWADAFEAGANKIDPR